jgi:ribosomal-protein-alanine N-acetyltransferase
LYWVITIKGSDQPAGTIAFWNFNHEERKGELGYELLLKHQGKGYMQEALKKIIDLGFHQLHLSAIEAWTHPENRSSIGVIEKLGFKRDHEAEQAKPPESKEIIYALSAAAYS